MTLKDDDGNPVVDTFQVYVFLNTPPTITSNGGGATASVSVAENTMAITIVIANDPDVGQVPSFSIIGGTDMARFTIGLLSGALTFNSPPNFETPFDAGANNVYDVTIQVSDGAGGTDTQAIAVTVTNVVPTTPTDGDAAANIVAEGAANATVVGLSASSTDPGGPAVTYSLTDDAGGRFAIDPATGIVTVANGALLDGPDLHTITVQASDDAPGGAGTSTQTFIIAVTNIGPSVAANHALVTVNEGQSAVNTGTWSDPGIDTVSLSVSVGTVTQNSNGTWSWTYAATDGPAQSQIVTITATDSDNAVTNTTFNLVVNNVAPTAFITGMLQPIAAFILPGQSLTFSGAYADVGVLDTQIAIWDFGDGSSSRSILAAGGAGTFNAAQAYSAAGTYVVKLTVKDKDGACASVQMTVVVQTPGQATGILCSLVDGLTNLNKGERNSLCVKLENAQKSIDRGNTTAAKNQLGAFKNEVAAMRKSNRLSPAQAQWLTDMADAIFSVL